jgi:hypothetical protein
LRPKRTPPLDTKATTEQLTPVNAELATKTAQLNPSAAKITTLETKLEASEGRFAALDATIVRTALRRNEGENVHVVRRIRIGCGIGAAGTTPPFHTRTKERDTPGYSYCTLRRALGLVFRRCCIPNFDSGNYEPEPFITANGISAVFTVLSGTRGADVRAGVEEFAAFARLLNVCCDRKNTKKMRCFTKHHA